jgi:rubredoxin
VFYREWRKIAMTSVVTEVRMKKYMCLLCGFIYDEAKGWPEDGIAAGTPWEKVSEDWMCPDCGASKSDFEMIEV